MSVEQSWWSQHRVSAGGIASWAVVALVAWLVSYAYLYGFAMGLARPLAYYAVFVAAALFAALIKAKVCRPRYSGLWVLWGALYLVYLLAGLGFGWESAGRVQEFVTATEAVALMLAFAVLFSSPEVLRRLPSMFAVVALFSVLVNAYDFVVPTFTNVPGRAAGLYVNPNLSGYFLVFSMIAGVGAVPVRWRSLFILIVGGGVMLTFSRSAVIMWAFALFYLLFFLRLRARASRRWAVLSLLVFMLFGWGLASGYFAHLASDSPLSSLMSDNTIQRLGGHGDEFADSASEERLLLLRGAWNAFLESPAWGHGVGYTSVWPYASGPHNMFLLFLAEGGAVGVTLYVFLSVLLMLSTRGVMRLLAWEFVLVSLFSHNVLNMPAVIAVMVFAVIRAAGSDGDHISLRTRTSVVPGA